MPLDKGEHLKCASFSYSIFIVLDKNKFKLIFIFDTFIVRLLLSLLIYPKKPANSTSSGRPIRAASSADVPTFG